MLKVVLLLGFDVVLVVFEWDQCHDGRDEVGRTNCLIR